MVFKNYSPTARHHYKITVNFNDTADAVTLAGFCADEQNEAIMSRHLFNVCKQSNGQFATTQHLVYNAVQQWQNYFNVNTTQLLCVATHIQKQRICKMSLYKMQEAGTEKLINTFKL
jgi:hypothetical protein